jgi:hypothetical protein
MKTYNRVPQHDEVEDNHRYNHSYNNRYGVDDVDLELQEEEEEEASIVSITVSRREKPDGSVVRIKETFLSDGTSQRQEQPVMSRPQPRLPSRRNANNDNDDDEQTTKISNKAAKKKQQRHHHASTTLLRFSDHHPQNNHDDDDDDDDYDYDHDDDDSIIWGGDIGGSESIRRDSLRIWPMSFLEEPEILTVLPQYKLRQSSDSRLRFYLAIFQYILLCFMIFAMIVFGTWFIINHHPMSYLRNMVNRPR